MMCKYDLKHTMCMYIGFYNKCIYIYIYLFIYIYIYLFIYIYIYLLIYIGASALPAIARAMKKHDDVISMISKGIWHI